MVSDNKYCKICQIYIFKPEPKRSRWFQGYRGTGLCKKCYNKTRLKITDSRGSILDLSKDEINNIDKESVALHDRNIEILTMRSRQGCKLFRCLICWHYIFLEDSIVEYKDGYAHKVCLSICIFPYIQYNRHMLAHDPM